MEVLVQQERTLLSSRSRSWGGIPLRVAFRQNCTENVECHASQILLQLRRKVLRTLSSSDHFYLRRVIDREGFNEAVLFNGNLFAHLKHWFGLDETLIGIPC